MPLTDDECYIQLRKSIIQGIFQPNERLVEMDLSQSLGAGRAAIRTALARLEQDGLVEHERYRGARVRLISPDEAIELLEARSALECLVARHAAVNATAEDVDALKGLLSDLGKRLESDDLLGYSDVNALLHQTLVRIAHHATAARLLEMLKSSNVRFQFRTILTPGRPRNSYQEHKAIVEAVARHDADAAEKAMRFHLQHVVEALKERVRLRPLTERDDI